MNISNINKINIEETINKIKEIKNKNKLIKNENEQLKTKLIIFKNKIKELCFYIGTLKDDINNKKHKMKQKIEKIINSYNNKINELNENLNEIKRKQITEIFNNKKDLKKNNNKENINLLNYNYKYNTKKNQNHYFQFLKLENNISIYIKNSINNFINKKKVNEQLFDFSQLHNDNNKNMQLHNNSINSLSFQQKEPINKIYSISYNINESFNKKNFKQKIIENEKLKEEIEYLKNEIKDLLIEINNQKKIISENNFSEINHKKNKNICDKCKYINNLIISSNIPDNHKLIEIKNIMLSSPFFDENIKNVIINIFDIINKLIEKNYNSFNIKKINTNYKTFLSSLNIKNGFNFSHNKFNISDFSELNIKLFSSSELKKYHIIYDEKTKNINELINIYIKRVNDIKNIFNGINLTYDSTVTINTNDDVSLNVHKKNRTTDLNKYNKKGINIPKIFEMENNYKNEETGYEYKNIHDEIIKLKNEKIIVDNLIELIKNYLIINEKVYNYFLVQNQNIDNLKKYIKKIFEIFKEYC